MRDADARAGLHFAHLWDNVALVAALGAVQASGWPWPPWIQDIITPDSEDEGEP
jgi:hypothetical protein